MQSTTSFDVLINRQSDFSRMGFCDDKIPPEAQCLLGQAGTGKTFSIRELIHKNPKYGILTSTTGIAAINLGGKTLHTTLKFFNLESLERQYRNGNLHNILHEIRKLYDNLIIEEVSMLHAQMLDIIYEAVADVNNGEEKQLGIVLLGDFCQLPPIEKDKTKKAKFVFEANCWPNFEQRTIKLEKIWRQDNPVFIEALNYLRCGDGQKAVNKLEECNVKFIQKIQPNFEGTTIIGTNEKVNEYNKERLIQIKQPMIRVSPIRRGVQAKEWEDDGKGGGIPIEQRFKKDAYVMILSNDIPDFTYVNGDCGHIIDYFPSTDKFRIKLVRNGNFVDIGKILRQNEIEGQPEQWQFNSMFKPYVDFKSGKWVVGEIKYHPLRLAYASTVHKSQGLTLDRVQIDTNAYNMQFPAMVYVAISRARNPENLIIVGNKKDLVQKIKTDKKVMRWI